MGSPWGNVEKEAWLKQQVIQRSYQDEVLKQIGALQEKFEVSQYGALPINKQRYPLFLLRSLDWQSNNKVVLITGGVHGYETSGVQGALKFAATQAHNFKDQFNFLIAPCISPWGYETINRWNSDAIDPNRSFYLNSPAPEAALIMQAIENLDVDIFAHFDLHETTDTDNSVFRPALAERDGIAQNTWNIPDGFYTVGDTANPQEEFQKAIIDSVRSVTHIAPPDNDGKIIGVPVTQDGVINYNVKKLFLCAGFSDAEYCTTTEVYPDSENVTDEDCKNAQVAAVIGGLNYLKTIMAK